MTINLKDYDCLVDYLNNLLESKKASNPMYSLRSWIRSLGYTYPSYISQCLRGKKFINYKFFNSLLQKECYSKEEKDYLTFLFLKHCCKESDQLDLTLLEGKLKEKLNDGPSLDEA